MKATKIVISFLIVLLSCSNPEEDYKPIQQLQNSAEQSIQSSGDDNVKLKFCDDVIKALDEFIKNNPKGEWNATAKSALQSWRIKRVLIQESIDRKLDFDNIQKLQDATEAIMQHSTDYAVRIKGCNDIINSLQTYISKHPEGDWTTTVRTSLMSWESRKATFEQVLNSLSNRLYIQLKTQAIAEAKNAHKLSNIEEARLDKRDQSTVGANILVTDIYAIRMRGAILGSHIFKMKITVSDGIDQSTKHIFVNDNVTLEE